MNDLVFKSSQFAAFARAIRQRESSDDYSNAKNPEHLGAYQLGVAALEDAGFLVEGNKTHFSQIDERDWSPFARSLGVNSITSFLSNPSAQDAAFQRFTQMNFEYLRNKQGYIGKTIDGIPLTESSLLAGAHLVGHRQLENFLLTNGQVIPHDEFGTKVTEYLADFSRYDFTFPSAASGHFEFSPAVDTHPKIAPDDPVAHSAVKPVEPGTAKPVTGHISAALDPQDFFTRLSPYLGSVPSGEDAQDFGAKPVSGAMGLHDRMIAVAQAVFEAEQENALASPIHGASADRTAKHRPDRSAQAAPAAVQVDRETVALAAALYKAIHKEVPAADGAGTHRRQGPTGHKDHPIFIYPRQNPGNT